MGYSRVESDGSRMCHELLRIDDGDDQAVVENLGSG